MTYGHIARQFLKLSLVVAFALPTAALADGPLNVRRDELRQRTWILAIDGVYVHDHEGGVRIRRYPLDGWIHVADRGIAPPDLVVEPSGTVLVSSNITPHLWRVDPDSAGAVQLRVVPKPPTERDIGFTALQVGERGEIQARSAIDGSAWRIDLAAQAATPATR